jgi:hypothetical protein
MAQLNDKSDKAKLAILLPRVVASGSALAEKNECVALVSGPLHALLTVR